MKRTPLYALHVEYGAKFTRFAGYEMPLHYGSIIEETLWTRRNASLFDVSHMARFLVSGADAEDFLNYSFSNDVRRLRGKRKAQYTLLLNERGGIHDDAYVYLLREGEYLVVLNAANREKDWNVLNRRREGFSVILQDITDKTAQVALQGPKALEVMASLSGIGELENAGRNRLFLWDELIITTTGYTGEKGVEIYGDGEKILEISREILKGEDVRWAGLGARDILRAEAGYPLYGKDIDEDTDPFSANLKWFVKMEKGEFVGKEALMEMTTTRIRRGLVRRGRGLTPSKGAPIAVGGERVGYITTAVFSPHVEGIVAMGYLPPDVEGEVEVEARGRTYVYTTSDYPFVPLPKW